MSKYFARILNVILLPTLAGKRRVNGFVLFIFVLVLSLPAVSLAESAELPSSHSDEIHIEVGKDHEEDEEHIHLIFGAYAAEKPTETVKELRPFLAYLSLAMTEILAEDVTIEMHISSDYGDSIQDMLIGEVDFSRFGPTAYVIAKKLNSDIQILAVETDGVQKARQGVVVVHQDSDIQSLQDLNGHSFAFGRKLSAIGHYLAQNLLLGAGQSAQTLAIYTYLDNPKQVSDAVARGVYDAGVLAAIDFETLNEAGVLRVIARFDTVSNSWITSRGLSPRVQGAMRRAILAATDQTVLDPLGTSGFLSGDDANFDAIRAAMLRSKTFGE